MLSQSVPHDVLVRHDHYFRIVSACSYYSVWLTLFVLLGSRGLMLVVVRSIGGRFGTLLPVQQQTLCSARSTAIIEEMMNGQKVIKVFCHEEQGQGGL